MPSKVAKLLITIILLFGTVVLGLFYVGPSWQKYRALRQDAEDLQAISGEFDELIKNRDLLIDTINSISKDDLANINKALPQGPQASEFLIVLDKMASKNRISLKNVDLSAPAAQVQAAPLGQPRPAGASQAVQLNAFAEFPVNLSLVGSYETLKSFLADLEKNIRLIDVQNISFSSPEKNNSFNFNIKAKTYYQ